MSKGLFDVLCRSQRLAKQTDGAFDVTVGPIVRLWRRARRRKQLPSPERLAEAIASVGYKNLRLDPEAQTVELLKPRMRLDLGGIAKGYAADAALAMLRKHGITRALVDGSGDIALGDPPPGANGWRIAIAPLDRGGIEKSSKDLVGCVEQANAGRCVPQVDLGPLTVNVDLTSPLPAQRTNPHRLAPRTLPAPRYLLLHNTAVATSGDRWQYVEIDGRRYSHLVDPHTGLGLTDHSSVTIIAPNCTTADSLASAVSVLGPKRGLELVEKTPGAAAYIERKPEGKFEAYESSRFRSLPTATRFD